MDSKYIISRLKSTPFKYPTAELMRSRLINLEQDERDQVISNLKFELCKECNTDIYVPLFELLYRMPLAS